MPDDDDVALQLYQLNSRLHAVGSDIAGLEAKIDRLTEARTRVQQGLGDINVAAGSSAAGQFHGEWRGRRFSEFGDFLNGQFADDWAEYVKQGLDVDSEMADRLAQLQGQLADDRSSADRLRGQINELNRR